MSNGRPTVGLIDTSVLIGAETKRPLRDGGLPERSVVSIITVGELRAGVLAAPDIETRDRRLVTLEQVSDATVLPIDDRVARAWAGMRAYLAVSKKSVSVNDLWIAATAAAQGIPVVTQDHDYYALSGVMGLAVVEV